MEVICALCGNPLEEPGALWFEPPDEEQRCEKHHLCKLCNKTIHDLISYYID